VKQLMYVDEDVQAVAAFMQGRIAASRLVAVADGLAALAPLLWGKFQPETIQAVRLEHAPITPAERTPAVASE
jgi:GTPase